MPAAIAAAEAGRILVVPPGNAAEAALHGFYTIGIANIIAPAMSHIELSAWSANRGAYAVTAAVSVAGIVHLWLNVVGADPEGFRGLTQRLFSSINSLWPFLVALYLLRSGSSALKAQPAH